MIDSPQRHPSGYPLEKVTDLLPSLASAPLVGTAFVPPVSAEAVARAAVQVRYALRFRVQGV